MEVKGGYQHLGVRQEADGTVCSLLRPLVELFFHWVSRRTKLVSLLTINFSALAILHLSTGNSFDFIPTFSPTSSFFSLPWHIIEQDFSRNWNFLVWQTRGQMKDIVIVTSPLNTKTFGNLIWPFWLPYLVFSSFVMFTLFINSRVSARWNQEVHSKTRGRQSSFRYNLWKFKKKIAKKTRLCNGCFS